MAKLICSATIPSIDERNLICEWLRDLRGCTHTVIGNTISLTYKDNDEEKEVLWSLIDMFEQYPEHSIARS